MDKDPIAIEHVAFEVAPSRGAGVKHHSLQPRTLAVDVGGSRVKAIVLSADGAALGDEVLIATPHPCPPEALLEILDKLIASLPDFERVSVGFPGFVRRGTIVTAPHLDTRYWQNFDLENELARALGRPTRVLNDADVQGFGLIEGNGLEMVLTLGTGVGTALFRDGDLMPHLEWAQHPVFTSAAAMRRGSSTPGGMCALAPMRRVSAVACGFGRPRTRRLRLAQARAQGPACSTCKPKRQNPSGPGRAHQRRPSR